jgi:integrase
MYWMSYTVSGKQRHESTGTHDRKMAKKILSVRMAEIIEGRWSIPSSNPPTVKAWSTQFLNSIQYPSTKTRYQLSVNQLLSFFGDESRLPDVASVRRIEEFKAKRLATGIKPATVNRDLSVLRRMLNLAVRQRLIARSPFTQVELLEEAKARRRPYILSYEDQIKFLAVAAPHLRCLIVLLTESGPRVNREAFALKWSDVDFEKFTVTVRESKSLAGRRTIPLSESCKTEMLGWKKLTGPEFSDWVFPNPKAPSTALKSVKKTWATALKRAGLPQFPIYNLRHTFATRLAAIGASPVVIAHLLGHSSTAIVMTYARAIDSAHRDAILKLDEFRRKAVISSNQALAR